MEIFGALGSWRKIDEKSDATIVKQINDASCVAAIGEMLAKNYRLNLSQVEILESIGIWSNAQELARFLNSKETRTEVEWIGGIFPPELKFIKGISRQNVWAAMLREGKPLGHAVLIRGLDENELVIIEDPFDQTTYKMTEENLFEVLSEFVLRRKKQK